MKLIFDTHVLLWWLEDPANVSEAARYAIADPNNEVYLSAVSVWEVAIKRGLGKLDAPSDFVEASVECGLLTLPISIQHALATEHLPMHHRDPFDRMLVAQAIVENATLLTRDPLIPPYGISTIRA